MPIDKKLRAERLGQKPAVLWFTGLSGAGKSTTACALERHLFAMGYSTYLLDGDCVRQGLCAKLGYSENERSENVRRLGEVAKLMIDAGLLVIVAAITPLAKDRQRVRDMVKEDRFIEIYVNTPLSECEKRDAKGLYKKARSGEIDNFTGIDSPYDIPTNPEITINTLNKGVKDIVESIVCQLQDTGVISDKRIK